MAEDLRMVLLQLRGKAELEDDVDFLRQGVRAMAQQLMEMDVAQHVRAEKYERGANRCGEHNGYRDRNWDSRVDDLLTSARHDQNLKEPGQAVQALVIEVERFRTRKSMESIPTLPDRVRRPQCVG
ncbi:MAG: hypothetical protein E6I75_30930 [Chloroflexi bacterium]|nr:MAG: hypothetical protein E6I75_30930 [Chloroflexota bacterium]